jgi:hypothetical protein
MGLTEWYLKDDQSMGSHFSDNAASSRAQKKTSSNNLVQRKGAKRDRKISINPPMPLQPTPPDQKHWLTLSWPLKLPAKHPELALPIPFNALRFNGFGFYHRTHTLFRIDYRFPINSTLNSCLVPVHALS